MENDYQLNRHTELWENQNKQIRRIVIFGLIIAYILLTNILKPYSNRIEEINSELSQLGKDTLIIKSNIEDLDNLDNTMELVKNNIRLQPWKDEKEKLIRKYQQMNISGSPSWEEYQREADSTVSNIGKMVLVQVGKPLQSFIEEESLSNSAPSLTNELKRLPDVVKEWKEENYGKRWYLTLDAKEATVQELTMDLDQQIRRISNQMNTAQIKIEAERNKLISEIEKLKAEIIEEEKSLPEKLDAEMKKILPNWISGIITLKQMMLYPFLILGVVIYTIIIAFELTRHHQFMTKGSRKSGSDDSDNMISSLWTLNYTSGWSTIKTVSVYVVFILIMWYFYEQGFNIFKNWQEKEINQMLSSSFAEVVLWLGRIAFLILLALVIRKPLTDRNSNPKVA